MRYSALVNAHTSPMILVASRIAIALWAALWQCPFCSCLHSVGLAHQKRYDQPLAYRYFFAADPHLVLSTHRLLGDFLDH